MAWALVVVSEALFEKHGRIPLRYPSFFGDFQFVMQDRGEDCLMLYEQYTIRTL